MDQDLKNKYFNKYGKRFNRRDKHACLVELSHDFEKLGLDSEIIKSRKRIGKVENLYVGNIKQAKRAIVIPYDTPSKIFWFKNNYYPLNGYENLQKMFVPTYAPIILVYVVILFLCYGLPYLFNGKINPTLLSVVVIVLLITLIMMIFKGFANKNNYVRNSASIVLALELCEELDKNKRKETMFIFSEIKKKYFGNDLVNEYLEANHKKSLEIISLYCLGQGKMIRVACDKRLKDESKKIVNKLKGNAYQSASVTFNQEDKDNTFIQNYTHVMGISSGEVVNNKLLLVKNSATSKDVSVDETLLERVKGVLLNYLN